jgi:hypothetical protein
LIAAEIRGFRRDLDLVLLASVLQNTGAEAITMREVVLSISVCVLLLSSCAHSVAVSPTKVEDAQLTCAQILSEIREAEKFRKAAEDNKGVTGTNAAAVLLFWPALIATYSDANAAIRAADDRKTNLIRMYNDKHCDQASP